MLAGIRDRLTYANVVATLALFVALGGASYAAVKLPAHSVGTRELKPGAVTSAKVRDGSLRARDFDRGALAHAKAGRDGAAGERGPGGASGPRGEAGTNGAKGDLGPAGDSGPAGQEGPAGSAGAAGPAGPDGPAGAPGSTGAAGPAGPPGPMGPQGAQGPGGPSGPAGPSGVVATARISGFIATVAAADNVWQFLGNQATVTTTASQRLTAAAMVPLGLTGVAVTIKLDLCYQSSAGGALNPFAGGGYSLVAVTPLRTSQGVAGSVVPGAGTWRVGACAQTAVALDNNDFVNGWVQVTN